MTWRQYVLLGILGLAMTAFVAAFQHSPGYMDADYYYAGGLQLVFGQGFSEPYIWNYLDDPAGLPHPSFSYWMPLASLLAATGAALFGPSSWFAARIGFLVVAATIPPLTAALAYSLTPRREFALFAGLLAIFSCFYLPFLPTTDTFGLYMLLGGTFLLLVDRKASLLNSICLGLIAGLMHLCRADGLLWLGLALVAAAFPKTAYGGQKPRTVFHLFSTLIGYLLVMGPWFTRNMVTFGTLLAPGGVRSLWLTYYDQLFAYPAAQLSFISWWKSGLVAILKSRLWAAGVNLASTLAVQGEVILLPLVGIGFWVLRRERRVLFAVLALLLTFGTLTILFPFAGARGGYFHSGAALQPIWWAVTPIGLERLIAWGVHQRGWKEKLARWIFSAATVGFVALISLVVVSGRVIGHSTGEPVWGQESSTYRHIADFLHPQGIFEDVTVVVANPPGFYLATGLSAIAVPDGNRETLLAVARRYRASVVVLEGGSTPRGLLPVYDHPDGQSSLRYLGEVEEARIFVIPP